MPQEVHTRPPSPLTRCSTIWSTLSTPNRERTASELIRATGALAHPDAVAQPGPARVLFEFFLGRQPSYTLGADACLHRDRRAPRSSPSRTPSATSPGGEPLRGISTGRGASPFDEGFLR